MNVKDPERVGDLIANWIGIYANRWGKKALVVGVTNDKQSILTALLCSRVGKHTKTIMDVVPRLICVHMTERSYASKARRLEEFLETHKIGKLELVPVPDTTIYREGFDPYPGGYPLEEEPNDHDRAIPLPGSKVEHLTNLFRSSMASVLAHYADVHDGLVVGTVTATQGLFQRRHRKFGDGAADIFPLLDLHDSEVQELLRHFNAEPASSIFPQDIQTSDIEWAHREESRNGIITNDLPPQQHYAMWYKYTAPQKQLIAELHAREKKTRHKKLTDKPYCRLRQTEGLFAQ